MNNMLMLLFISQLLLFIIFGIFKE